MECHSPVVAGALPVRTERHVLIGTSLARQRVGIVEHPCLCRRLLEDEGALSARPAGFLVEILAALVGLQQDPGSAVVIWRIGGRVRYSGGGAGVDLLPECVRETLSNYR